jgi:hypothetical protein
MKRIEVAIERLVVDAAAIGPGQSQRFRWEVEAALRAQFESAGAASPVLPKNKESISVAAERSEGPVNSARLAANVAQAIHQSLGRKE